MSLPEMNDDDSVDEEILKEYLPIFESLRRQALSSDGDATFAEASTSKIPENEEILKEYLPIFESLRRQALSSDGDATFTEASTSAIPENEEISIDVPGEVSMQDAFGDDFMITDESLTTVSINKEEADLVENKISSNYNTLTVDSNIEFGSAQGLSKIEKDGEEDGAVKIDQNQNAAKKINENKKLITDNKPSITADVPTFSKRVYYPNTAYLHRIEACIKKSVVCQIPALVIKDMLNAKHYNIHGKFRSIYLYEIGGLVFNNVKCRATVVGVSHGNTFEFVLGDGTGSIRCVLDKEIAQNQGVLPIIEDFHVGQVTYETITSGYDVERGETVQIVGHLEEHFGKRRVVVKKLCKESRVLLVRDIVYFRYLEGLAETYKKWKSNIAKIVR